MSTLPRVIVRAYGDEPVPLFVSKVTGNRVVVTNAEESTTLSLPARSVFEFDEARLVELLAAFDKRDTDHLSILWDESIAYLKENVLQ